MAGMTSSVAFTSKRNCFIFFFILTKLALPICAQPVVPVDGQVFLTNAILAPGVYSLPNGLSIGAAGVTLDLNGATLVGTNFKNYGVTSLGNDDVVIRNGTISGYYYGIRVESGSNVQVLNNNLSTNYIDPNSQTANPPFLDINVGPNLGDLVNLGGGLFLRNATGAIVSSNIMRFGENGMDLYHVAASTINGNNASDNSGWGIHLYSCVSNHVFGNVSDRCTRVNLNDSAGFLLVYASSYNQIISNSFQYGGDGFFSGNENGCPSDNNLIQGNNGSYAGANAFEATFESGNQFIGNIANFSNYGFWLGYSHDGNLISSNSIRANNANGIEIDHGQHNVIDGNDIIGNGGSGIVLDTDGQPHFPVNSPCLNLPNPAASSFYTIRNNRIYGNFGIAMVLTATTDSLIYNNLFGGPEAGTVTSNGGNNVWAVTPQPGTNIVGGPTIAGNWWFDYTGIDTNSDGLGDTKVPYTNAGKLVAPGDPKPLIGSPGLGGLGNPATMTDYTWIDLGRNTRTTGATFSTANGTHFATDGTNLFLLEGANTAALSLFDPTKNRYQARTAIPEAVQDGGDFQYGGGPYYATVGLGFDTTTGAGNGSHLYAYNPSPGSGNWAAKAPTTVNGKLVCNEALAFDPVGKRLYATIVNVKTAAAGGDATLLTKLAVYNPASNVWTGATAAAPDSWSNASEAEYLDGCIYVWRGGSAGAIVNGSDSYLDVYDIASNSWTRTPSLRDFSVVPGFRSGGQDIWGVAITSDAAHHRLFVLGAESNHQIYVFDAVAQTWSVAPAAPYDGGWGDAFEYVPATGRLYQLDGRNSGGTPQGTAVMLRFALGGQIQSPATLLLSWSSVANRNYQVQYKTNLTQPDWLNLGGVVTTTNSTATNSDTIGQLIQRYYRIALVL